MSANGERQSLLRRARTGIGIAAVSGAMDTTEAQSSRDSDRRLVLVVDDHAPSRSALQVLLEDDGYEVVVAANGLEGLELAMSRAPDIVLSDVQMPKMDGLTMLDHLCEVAPRLPVVLMSAAPEMARLAARAHAFLSKPICFDELERTVQCLLGHRDHCPH